MKVLDLFSGIGGFSLGLERAGFETVAFCEIDPFCRQVLNKHWPDIPIHEDIKQLDGRQYRGTVDVVCGGFPCQDISWAGEGIGISGKRSGLWKEFARLVCEVRPRYSIVENSTALLARSRGAGVVLGDLAQIGYDAEWYCIPASAVGAPHERDRVWILAYPNGDQHEVSSHAKFGATLARLLATYANADGYGELQQEGSEREERRRIGNSSWWAAQPDVARVVYGFPRQVDYVRALGNAVVPQIPEVLGKAILEVEHELP